MKEIKFRAWDGVDYMSNPFTLHDIQDGKIEFTHDEKIVFMQYTGLKDKNGVEIYKGDIMLIKERGANYPLKYIVVFNEPELGFRLRWEGRYKETDSGFYDKKISQSSYEVFEIIGNIYSNPELLNSDKEV